jgi:hypothetical protein
MEQELGPLTVELATYMHPARRQLAFKMAEFIEEKFGKQARLQCWQRAKSMRSNRDVSGETNPFVTEETNSAEMARLQRQLKKETDPDKKDAIKLNIRKLKGEMELRKRDKVTESVEQDIADPDPKIASLARTVLKLKQQRAALMGNDVEESTINELSPDTYSNVMTKLSDEDDKPVWDDTKRPTKPKDKKAFNIAFNRRYLSAKPGETVRANETVVPGFGDMKPEQIENEVKEMLKDMMKYAGDGNMAAVKMYIDKLLPFVETAGKLHEGVVKQIDESTDDAIRMVRRNAV